jgi:cell shape-determining protein MreD
MSRILILVGLGLLLHAAESAVAVILGMTSLPVAPAVVLVAYAALVEPPVEASLSASSLGLVLDALSGSPLGLNMLACLLALLLGRLAAGWVSSPRGLGAFAFASLLSAGYYLFVLTLLFVFGTDRESFGLQGLTTTSLMNGLLALLLFPICQKLLVWVGLEERSESMEERLKQRARGT